MPTTLASPAPTLQTSTSPVADGAVCTPKIAARDLLRELHRRAPKDVAMCAGIGVMPFPTAHVLSRAAHEARAIAIRAAREMYFTTARDGWAAYYSLLALRAVVLGEDAEAARLLSYARRCVPT